MTGATIDLLSIISPQFKMAQEDISGTPIGFGENRRKAEQGESHVMIPLPFYFCHETCDYLPCQARLSKDKPLYAFTVEFVDPASIVGSAKLVFKTIIFDNKEHQMQNVVDARFTKIMLLTKTMTETETGPGTLTAVRMSPQFMKMDCVKDLLITFESQDGDDVNDVQQIHVMFNGTSHMKLSGLMAGTVIPRRFYGISQTDCANKKRVYIVPFCQDHIQRKCTSDISFGRIDSAFLYFTTNKSVSYRVTIVARYYAVHGVCNGNGIGCGIA
jgi:hypothetical protein